MPWVRFTSTPAAHEMAQAGQYAEGGEYELEEASVVRWERRGRVVRIDGPSEHSDMASSRPVPRRMPSRAPVAVSAETSGAALPQLDTTSEQLPPRPRDSVTVTMGKDKD